MGETNEVEREELLAFKGEILAALGKVENNIGEKINQLTLELKAQNKAIVDQDKKQALLEQKVDGVVACVKELESRTDKNSDKILVNETKQESNTTQIKWWMAVAGFFITVITFILKYWPIGV